MATRMAALPDDELAALFTRAQTGDRDAMDRAMEELEPLLLWLCKPLLKRKVRTIDTEDIIQEARLEAVQAIREFDPSSTVSPRSAAVFAARSRVSYKLWANGKREARDLSLDAPISEDDRTIAHIGLPELITTDNLELRELDHLLDRLPSGKAWVGGNRTLNRLVQHTNDRLPDDDRLIELIKSGVSLPRLSEMFGVAPENIRYRVQLIRRSGRQVPPLAREQRAPNTQMAKMPWEDKRRIIADYLECNPGVGNKTAGAALGVSGLTVARARRELSQVS